MAAGEVAQGRSGGKIIEIDRRPGAVSSSHDVEAQERAACDARLRPRWDEIGQDDLPIDDQGCSDVEVLGGAVEGRHDDLKASSGYARQVVRDAQSEGPAVGVVEHVAGVGRRRSVARRREADRLHGRRVCDDGPGPRSDGIGVLDPGMILGRRRQRELPSLRLRWQGAAEQAVHVDPGHVDVGARVLEHREMVLDVLLVADIDTERRGRTRKPRRCVHGLRHRVASLSSGA